tara:strand:+ start:280 stop:534 length:255 start_codon:yes stop_codon:yes gene_type:complete
MVAVTITRSGRKIKKPETYVPIEEVLEDDYADNEYDSTGGSDIDTDEEECSSDEDEYEEEDADDNGNLKDFVVDDESESEEEDA